MKHLLSILTFSIILILIGCNESNKPTNDETYQYVEETIELNDYLKQKIGDWAEKGVICYGIVALQNTDGTLKYGKPVKSKILRIKTDSIKMKSLEKINLAEKKGCDKIGISYGDTWWESEGDIFKTRDEAEAFLKKNSLEVK